MRSWPAIAFLGAMAVTGCSSPDRSAVAWSDLQVSDDRRTVEVTTSYGPFCRRVADGVDVEVRDDEIVVTAWLRDQQTDGRDDCTAECGEVTQTVTVAEPLPSDRPIHPPADHVLGCDR